MTEPHTLRNISTPPNPNRGASNEFIWNDSDQSVLFRGLVTALGVDISPELRAEIEERLPGVNTGDIESGHVLLVQNRELSDGFEFGYYLRNDETMRHHKVTLINTDDVEAFAAAFAILAGWQSSHGGSL